MNLLKFTSLRSVTKELKRLNFLLEAWLRHINVPLDVSKEPEQASLSYVDEELDAICEMAVKMGKDRERVEDLKEEYLKEGRSVDGGVE